MLDEIKNTLLSLLVKLIQLNKMKSINDIKINLINLITMLSDYKQLLAIYAAVQSELKVQPTDSTKSTSIDKFEMGKVIIRSNVSKNQIFKEQGKQSISFQEVKEIMTEEPWDLSLDELLATLN